MNFQTRVARTLSALKTLRDDIYTESNYAHPRYAGDLARTEAAVDLAIAALATLQHQHPNILLTQGQNWNPRYIESFAPALVATKAAVEQANVAFTDAILNRRAERPGSWTGPQA